MQPDQTETIDFQAELLRLRNEVQALAHANVHAAQLMAELQEARELEELLKANNAQLERAKRTEEDRGRFLELVALNQPEEVLLSSLGDLLHRQAPVLAFSFLLPFGGELRHASSRGLSAELAAELGCAAFSAAGSVRKAMAIKRPALALDLGQREGAGPVCKLLRSHGFHSLYCCPALNAGGRLLGMIAVYRPESREPERELKQLLEQATTLFAMGVNHRLMTERLTFQAHHDTLTSLPNRTYFYEALQDALTGSSFKAKKVAVLWADLDRFKQINDTLGHRSADLLLQMVAKRLSGCVAERGMVARMGGDEFVVLMRDIEGIEPAEQLAREILAEFKEPFGFGEHQFPLGMSIGISLYPDHGEDAEELVRNADLAMYAAKHAGRNTYVCFTRENETSTLETFQIEFHLRRALELGELELYYQPLVACKDGSIAAFETLLRWFSPALGRVSPAQFIPVAEASGLMQDIGKWVLEQACLHAASWQNEAPGVRVAVNVSVTQLARGDFHEVVERALSMSGLAPSLLELELTESAVIGIDDYQRHTAALRDLGVSLAIDDFGTGYSSLSYLHTLHVDTLKIDQSFVRAMGKEPSSARLAETIIGMAKSLGLQVVAEGLETLEQLQWLTDLHCDLLQGYYMHRPMTLEAAYGVLQAQRALAEVPLP